MASIRGTRRVGMDAEQFADVVHDQFKLCEDVLIDKAREYATEDRLHNFRVAADLQGVPMQTALAGMMAKHTISIYDMCRSEQMPKSRAWSEKITDHINYLILLQAIVVEYENDQAEFLDEVSELFAHREMDPDA